MSRVSLPTTDEVMLLHYKFLSVDYVTERYFQLTSRRGLVDRKNGWDFHFTLMPSQIRQQFDSYQKRFVDISAVGFSPRAVHKIPLWRTTRFGEQGAVGPHSVAHWM